MLYVLVRVQTQRYAIAATHVAHVLPPVEWRDVPGTSDATLGLIDYHTRPVPLIDLALVLGGGATSLSMGSRILILDDGRIGVLVEQVLGTFREHLSGEGDASRSLDAPYLGPIVSDSGGMIQRIEVDQLLAAYAS